jgi:hypothetical protein
VFKHVLRVMCTAKPAMVDVVDHNDDDDDEKELFHTSFESKPKEGTTLCWPFFPVPTQLLSSF